MGFDLGLFLEDIEEHREHIFIEVLVIFTADLILEVVDLRLFQEVECRLVLGQVDDSLGSCRTALGVRSPLCLLAGSPALGVFLSVSVPFHQVGRIPPKRSSRSSPTVSLESDSAAGALSIGLASDPANSAIL